MYGTVYVPTYYTVLRTVRYCVPTYPYRTSIGTVENKNNNFAHDAQFELVGFDTYLRPDHLKTVFEYGASVCVCAAKALRNWRCPADKKYNNGESRETLRPKPDIVSIFRHAAA